MSPASLNRGVPGFMEKLSNLRLQLLTRFDLLNHRFVVVVLHLSDVQQGVGVPVVGGPVVHKDPRAAAATVHNNPIIQSGVEDISGLHGLGHREVSGRDGEKHRNQRFCAESDLVEYLKYVTSKQKIGLKTIFSDTCTLS